jgi:Family of unknown function (DUF6353)
MKFNEIAKVVEKTLRSNSPAILTGLGVSGTLTTAILVGKASFKAGARITESNARAELYDVEPKTTKEKVKMVWKFYIPSAVSGTLTIGCIVAGARIGSKRAAAAYSLLSVSEKAFVEYKEKVVEQLGERKEKAVRDEIAQDHINANPPTLILGAGPVLCYEAHTGRYFNSDIETLRKAQNTINAQMIRENEASANDFYYLVGLPQTSYSGFVGWTSNKMLELQFSAVMAEDGRPCISFDYNYIKQL